MDFLLFSFPRRSDSGVAQFNGFPKFQLFAVVFMSGNLHQQGFGDFIIRRRIFLFDFIGKFVQVEDVADGGFGLQVATTAYYALLADTVGERFGGMEEGWKIG